MGSLFAGIGGFDLGFERAGFEIAWQVEINEWCRGVLRKHFLKAERFDDVRTVGSYNLRPVDVLAGGFPCQDISSAGRMAGIDGERSGLWSEYARIIGELRPRFVVVENVAALLERGMGRVLGDLASLGYDAEWEVVSACAVGAPHMRKRVWIVAYPDSERLQGWSAFGKGWGTETFPEKAVWRDLPTPYVCRGSDGIPDRAHRLHALGNAVVPQIPEMIARRLMARLEVSQPHSEASDAPETAQNALESGSR